MQAGPKPPVAKYGQPNLAVRHLCPNCQIDPPNIVEEYSHGDLVCGDCGTILGDRIVDTRSEWRTFAGDEGGDDPSRVGGPSNPLLGVQTLETTISARDGRTGMSRDLQRAQNRSNQQTSGTGTKSTQQLSAAFARIQEFSDAMQLPRSVCDVACHAFRIGDENRISRGKNDDPLIAASLVFACRHAHADRSFREVTKVTKVTKSDLGRVFAQLRSAIQKQGIDFGRSHSNSKQSIDGLIGRMVNLLDLGQTIYNAAFYVAKEAIQKASIDGRSPVSIAAGSVYFTVILFGKSATPKEIQNIAGVSESTIKLISKKIAEDVDLVIKPEWKTQYPTGYTALTNLGKPSASKQSRAGTPAVNGKDKDKNGSTPSPESKDAKSKDKSKDKAKDSKENGTKGEKEKEANGKAGKA